MKPCKFLINDDDHCTITYKTCVVVKKFVTSDNVIKKKYPNIERCPSYEKNISGPVKEIIEDELTD
jgi:hypothetical protein